MLGRTCRFCYRRMFIKKNQKKQQQQNVMLLITWLGHECFCFFLKSDLRLRKWFIYIIFSWISGAGITWIESRQEPYHLRVYTRAVFKMVSSRAWKIQAFLTAGQKVQGVESDLIRVILSGRSQAKSPGYASGWISVFNMCTELCGLGVRLIGRVGSQPAPPHGLLDLSWGKNWDY